MYCSYLPPLTKPKRSIVTVTSRPGLRHSLDRHTPRAPLGYARALGPAGAKLQVSKAVSITGDDRGYGNWLRRCGGWVPVSAGPSALSAWPWRPCRRSPAGESFPTAPAPFITLLRGNLESNEWHHVTRPHSCLRLRHYAQADHVGGMALTSEDEASPYPMPCNAGDNPDRYASEYQTERPIHAKRDTARDGPFMPI